MPKGVQLTDKQEPELRRRFFYLHHDPKVIAADAGISTSRLRRIVGGPLNPKFQSMAIERVRR